MVRHRDSGETVCKGTTFVDLMDMAREAGTPKEGRVETIYTPQGMGLQFYTVLPHAPQYGDREFPHSRSASYLATREHEGDKLTSDERKALAGYRQYPNSQELGYFAGLEKQGKLTPAMKKEFQEAKEEAGCLTSARVQKDGSIEFKR